MNNKGINWIPVTEKLPIKDKDYLVTDGDACMVSFFKTEDQEWCFFDLDWWLHDEVTHWMTLPELPKY